MNDDTLKRLKQFQEDLSEIVGPELAMTIVNFARKPNELEAEFLKSDGLDGLEDTQRLAVLNLIEHYRTG